MMGFQGMPSGRAAASRRTPFGLLVLTAACGLATPAPAQMLVGDGTLRCGAAYVVASGDTLSRVAGRAYGDPLLYPLLYPLLVDANRDALGGNAEALRIGMALAVPCVDISGTPLSAEQVAAAAASMEAVVAVAGPLSPAELDTLFGPVALFPDLVLTQVLVATTVPLDVVKAARFVDVAADLPDKDRAAKAAEAPWDASVRELAAGFPALVTRMSENVDWTEQAGEAVVAQTDAVLAAIQRLRTKAQDNGYLVDNEAQSVETVNDKIVIEPASPGVVYVPTYDSKVVYTSTAVSPPVYHYGHDDVIYYDDDDWDEVLVTGGIILGGAIILDEIFDDDDWDGWDDDDDIDWDRGDITIDRDDVDIDIDRGAIDRGEIGRGEIGRGEIGGDRPRVGDGGRVSIGDKARPPVAGGDFPGVGANLDRAGRESIATPASRDVARQKIEARQRTGTAPAELRTARPATPPKSGALTKSRSSGDVAISRPKAKQTPAVRAPAQSTVFQQPSRSRPSMAGNPGRSSAGRGGARGGGRRR